MSYFSHDRDADATLYLKLMNPATRQPVLGATPEVKIRRHRNSITGDLLDNYYWDDSDFVVAPQWLSMAEYDGTNNPGLYIYFFEQSLVPANVVCFVYFRNIALPAIGFDIEEHIFEEMADGAPSEGSPFDPTGVIP